MLAKAGDPGLRLLLGKTGVLVNDKKKKMVIFWSSCRGSVVNESD